MRIRIAFCLGMTLFATACGSGGITPDPPAASAILAVTGSGNSVRIHAGPDSADAGTTALVVAGGSGQGVVAGDGSFTFDAEPDTVAAVSTAGSLLTVQYIKENTTIESSATVQSLDARVTNSVFSTGSAPNDLVYGNSSLYVANSLDNSVVRHGLQGEELASLSFPQFTSPSYLTLGGNAVWVVANGDNTVTGVEENDLGNLASSDFLLVGEDVAYIGPGSPLLIGSEVFVPRSEIAAFGPPTVYGPGKISRLDFGRGDVSLIETQGKNPQYLAYDNTKQYLYVVCTGELQFDEEFRPFMTGSSTLEAYDLGDTGAEPVFSIDLGPVGAGAIALSQNGKIAWLGNALSGSLYSVDLEQRQMIHGIDNPVVLTEEFTYVADLEFTPDGRYLIAPSFNTDEVYVIDAQTGEVNPGPYPEPFDLALDPQLLAGALRVELVSAPGKTANNQLYVLFAVANTVSRIDLF